ncbi:hypothetical protein NE237_002493 [Protea cynaroides]|uniref:Uncharacterized protein n=1 Tax=Protea cynaroides TaxID=273540 RepID=A0A9Q0KVD2_9MAGN|nr:hypothetical protein NE237_002493 [Protea cynaroides]
MQMQNTRHPRTDFMVLCSGGLQQGEKGGENACNSSGEKVATKTTNELNMSSPTSIHFGDLCSSSADASSFCVENDVGVIPSTSTIVPAISGSSSVSVGLAPLQEARQLESHRSWPQILPPRPPLLPSPPASRFLPPPPYPQIPIKGLTPADLSGYRSRRWIPNEIILPFNNVSSIYHLIPPWPPLESLSQQRRLEILIEMKMLKNQQRRITRFKNFEIDLQKEGSIPESDTLIAF